MHKLRLWFSLNWRECYYGDVAESFHPTMVLAQPRLPRTVLRPLSGFHPTMVLAQPVIVLSKDDEDRVFPSHYGSRSTMTKAKYIIRKVKSFHPTMVLAQLVVVDGNYLLETSFHPTMVLAQPL